MKPINLNYLMLCFEGAISIGLNYVVLKVQIKVEEDTTEEYIVIPNKYLETKLKYYTTAYDTELNHKFSKGVSIIDIVTLNDLGTLEDRFKGGVLIV